MMQTSTIVAISVGTVVTGFLAYAVYFDHKRRTDVGFRKELKRGARRQERMQEKMNKEAKESEGKQQQEAIRRAVESTLDEGFPVDLEEREAYFMAEVGRGEQLNGQGSDTVAAALSFYKALKVYPEPQQLIEIYDSTVSKDILGVLAVMCAQDKELNRKIGGSRAGSDAGQVE